MTERGKKLLADAGYPNGFTVPFYFTQDRLPGDSQVGGQSDCPAGAPCYSRSVCGTTISMPIEAPAPGTYLDRPDHSGDRLAGRGWWTPPLGTRFGL